MHGRQEVVFLVVEHVVAHGNARCHQLGDASFHEFLRQLRVFQLVADGHASARPDELRQIGVEGVIGKSRHLVLSLRACSVVSVGERDAQDARGIYGIVAVGLVEIATAEQQQRVGMFLLQREKLLHHGRQAFIVFCHFERFLSCKITFFRRKCKNMKAFL